MKVLIVFAHPNEASFNGAVLKAATEALDQGKHEVRVRDLYGAGWTGFSPMVSHTG